MQKKLSKEKINNVVSLQENYEALIFKVFFGNICCNEL